MPPPHDGNEYQSFANLVKLEQIDELTFRSIALPFSPGRHGGQYMPGRAYGGHVYAQAAWAGCQTVTKDLLLHNVVGIFLLSGEASIPFVYHVEKTRDGRSFSTRLVHVTQGEREDVCFTALLSFKVAEENIVNVQEQVDLWSLYKPALDGKQPADFPEVPAVDLPWYWKQRAETGENEICPGLESAMVDMDPYNQDKHPLDRRQLIFYRAAGELPNDPNLHLCAHLYASDRNSLFIVANNMDLGEVVKQTSSLVHMCVFHHPVEALMFGPAKISRSPMDGSGDSGRWFGHESWTTRSSSNRAVFHSRLWAPDGTQVGTVMQDGMMRYTAKPQATSQELAAIKEKQSQWKSREKL